MSSGSRRDGRGSGLRRASLTRSSRAAPARTWPMSGSSSAPRPGCPEPPVRRPTPRSGRARVPSGTATRRLAAAHRRAAAVRPLGASRGRCPVTRCAAVRVASTRPPWTLTQLAVRETGWRSSRSCRLKREHQPDDHERGEQHEGAGRREQRHEGVGQETADPTTAALRLEDRRDRGPRTPRGPTRRRWRARRGVMPQPDPGRLPGPAATYQPAAEQQERQQPAPGPEPRRDPVAPPVRQRALTGQDERDERDRAERPAARSRRSSARHPGVTPVREAARRAARRGRAGAGRAGRRRRRRVAIAQTSTTTGKTIGRRFVCSYR